MSMNMAGFNRRGKASYIHTAIHVVCLVYFLTRSPTCTSIFQQAELKSALAQGSNGIPSTEWTDLSAVDKVRSYIATQLGREGSAADELYNELKPARDGNSLSSTTNSFPSEFPKLVWQTASKEGRAEWIKKADTWADLEGYKYNFLNDDDATAYVHAHFNETHPGVVHFWDSIATPVIRADFLRYLVMLASGGVYSDIDTTVLVNPDLWIPESMDVSKVNAIIGIEYDDNTYPLFIRNISFCQWTLMSKPNHPIFETAVQRVISNLEFLARQKRVEIPDLKPAKNEVLAATGPGMITDVVVQVIRDQGYDVSWRTFHEQKEPVLFGDVLILPVNGFAGNQKHSHSGKPEYGQRFINHHFGRSWYKHNKDAAAHIDSAKKVGS